MKNFQPTIIQEGQEYRYSNYANERFAGNLGYMFEGKYVEYTIHSLDEFDTEWVHESFVNGICRRKPGEKFFRCRSNASDIMSKWGFIVKVNIEKGLIYFLSENGRENDTLDFESRGIQLKYLNLKK